MLNLILGDGALSATHPSQLLKVRGFTHQCVISITDRLVIRPEKDDLRLPDRGFGSPVFTPTLYEWYSAERSG